MPSAARVKLPVYGQAPAAGELIEDWLAEDDVVVAGAGGELKAKLSVRFDDRVRAGDGEMDKAGVTLRRDNEVVLELMLGAVVEEVNAGINACRAGGCVGGDAGARVGWIAADVVDVPGERPFGRERGLGVGALQRHANGGAGRGGRLVLLTGFLRGGIVLVEYQRGGAGLEHYAVMAAPRQEQNGWVKLPAVGLKAERKLAIQGVDRCRWVRGRRLERGGLS